MIKFPQGTNPKEKHLVQSHKTKTATSRISHSTEKASFTPVSGQFSSATHRPSLTAWPGNAGAGWWTVSLLIQKVSPTDDHKAVKAADNPGSHSTGTHRRVFSTPRNSSISTANRNVTEVANCYFESWLKLVNIPILNYHHINT